MRAFSSFHESFSSPNNVADFRTASHGVCDSYDQMQLIQLERKTQLNFALSSEDHAISILKIYRDYFKIPSIIKGLNS